MRNRAQAWTLLALVAVLGTAVVVANPAQDQESVAQPQGSFSSDFEFNLHWLSVGMPDALGPMDRLLFSRPLLRGRFSLSNEATGLMAILGLVAQKEMHQPGSTNLPLDGPAPNPYPLENNALMEGILRYQNPWLSLSLGRQAVSQGPSKRSNLQLTGQVPYYDGLFVEMDLTSHWSFSQLISLLENRKVGSSDLDESKFEPPVPGSYDFHVTSILVSSRRFQWSNDWLAAGIGAITIVSRPYNVLYFGDILPVFSVHNADQVPHNFSLHADLSLSLLEGHRQYLIGGLDDFNASTVGIGDTGIPTIWAYVLGAEGGFQWGKAGLSYLCELIGTHYLWGSFHYKHGLSRAIYRYWGDSEFLIPLTSPYGPGRLSFTAELGLDLPSRTGISLSGLLLSGDPAINLVDTAYEAQAFNREFMLFRLDALVRQALWRGWEAYAGAGFDYSPDGFEPRFQAGCRWRMQAGEQP